MATDACVDAVVDAVAEHRRANREFGAGAARLAISLSASIISPFRLPAPRPSLALFPRPHHERAMYESEMFHGTDKQFQRSFRVHRALFQRLLGDLEDRDEFQVRYNNINTAMSVRLQLAIVLYRLGRTHSVNDVARHFGVSVGSVVNATRKVVRAIIAEYAQEYIGDLWPTTAEAVATNAAGFQKFAGIRNVVAAIDGTHVKIVQPKDDQASYFNRKYYYSVSFQVACDASYNVIWMSGARHGTIHDSRALDESNFAANLALVPAPGMIIGDLGYTRDARVLVPFKGLSDVCEPTALHRFNFHHAQTRGVIEKVFGVLKARFRWMLHGVHLKANGGSVPAMAEVHSARHLALYLHRSQFPRCLRADGTDAGQQQSPAMSHASWQAQRRSLEIA
jgi:hypothetical protein